MSWLTALWSRSGKQLRRAAGFILAAFAVGFGVEWLANSNARMLPSPGIAINDIALSPDGEVVAIAFSDGLVELRSTGHRGEVLRAFRNPLAPTMDLHLDAPGDLPLRLIMARADGTMRLEAAEDGLPLSDTLTFSQSILTPQFTVAPDGDIWVQGISEDGPWLAQLPVGEILATPVSMGDTTSPKLQLLGAVDDRVHVLTPDEHQVWTAFNDEADPSGLGFPIASEQRLPRGDNHVALQDGRLLKLEHGVWRNVGGPEDDLIETTSEPLQRSFGNSEEAFQLPTLAFSNDGRSILTAGSDGMVRIWDLDAGNHFEWQAHDDSISTAVFSPNGAEVLTASADGFVRRWGIDGFLLAEVLASSGFANSANFSPDGSKFVTSGSDGTLRFWDSDGSPWSLPISQEAAVSGATFTPDGQHIVYSTSSGFLNVLDIGEDGLPSFSDVNPMRGPDRLAFTLMIAPNGNTIAHTNMLSNMVHLWSVTGEELGKFSAGDVPVPAAAFRNNGSEIITGDENGVIKLWSLERASEPEPAPLTEDSTAPVQDTAPRARGVASSRASSEPEVAPQTEEIEIFLAAEIGNHGAQVLALDVSPDGDRIATTGTDGTIRIWAQTAPGVWEQARFGHDCNPQDPEAVLSGNGDAQRWLWFRGEANRLCAIGLSGFSRNAPLPVDTTVVAFPIQPDVNEVSSILVGRENGTVEHRTPLGEAPLSTYHGHQGPITQIETVALSSGYRAAIAGADGSVQIVDFPFENTTAFATANTWIGRVLSDANAVRSGMVDLVMPKTSGIGVSPGHTGYRPPDPLLDLQWNLKSSNEIAGAAGFLDYWRETGNIGDRDVVVAVVDTGLVYDHPSLTGANILPGWDMVSDPDMANDGDGGRDNDPSDPGDACGLTNLSSYQGTQIMSVLASPHDEAGIAGLAPGVSYVPVRALGSCGGSLSDVNAAISWAAGLTPDIDQNENQVWNQNPADIIALGLGWTQACPSSMQAMIDQVVETGTLVVATAGNGSTGTDDYAPAGCNNVLTVSAADGFGFLTSYSNFGSSVELMATGGDLSQDDNGDGEPDGILRAAVGNNCTIPAQSTADHLCPFDYSGDGVMALAHTVVALALLKSEDPTLTNEQLSARLLNDATRPVDEAATAIACDNLDAPRTLEQLVDACSRPVGGRILDMTALLSIK